MKMTFTILLLTLCLPAFSQTHAGITDPAILAMRLTGDCATEKDKVKAIFSWITTNIAYHRMDVREGRKRNKKIVIEDADDGSALR